MPAGDGKSYDFFLSRRGSIAAVAREVADVLTDKGYKVLVQDYDMPFGASFVEAMHEAVQKCRDLIVLYTHDYEQSPYTRKEFTSFEAERAQSTEERYIIVLRCEDVPLRGLLADNVYQDLVGVGDPEERKRLIIAAAERQSQAKRPPPRPFIRVPPRIASFTGRNDELDRLDSILAHDKPAAVTQAVGRAAVQGLGGVGKSALAVEYAYRYRSFYAGVCWCPADLGATLLNALAGLAVTLGVAPAEEADIEKMARAALRRLAEQRATWLLIYDDAPCPTAIADFLPSAGAHVLITSRFSDWGAWAEEVALDVLPLDQAVAFLQSRARRNDVGGAEKLALALGNLPLALDHAAAYCRLTNTSFNIYEQKISSLIGTVPPGASYPASVAATLTVAIEKAAAECSTATTLLAHFAYLAPSRIPLHLITEDVASEDARAQALLALTSVSLVVHSSYEPTLNVHPLVQLVVRSRWGTDAPAIVGALTRNLAHQFPGGTQYEPDAWPECAALLPHVLALRSQNAWNEASAIDAITLLSAAASYLAGRGRPEDAEDLINQAISICDMTIGRSNRWAASCINDLSAFLVNCGRNADAEAAVTEALAITEEVSGRDSIEYATYLGNFANVLATTNRPIEAEGAYKEAIALIEKQVGPVHRQMVYALANYGRLLIQFGRFSEADQVYKKALSMAPHVLGPESLLLASLIDSFGAFLLEKGDYQRAVLCYRSSLSIRERAFGRQDPRVGVAIRELATALQMTDQLQEAEELYGEAIGIIESSSGTDDANLIFCYNNLANTLLRLRRLDEAKSCYLRALSIGENAFGSDHPEVALTASNVANLLMEAQQIGEAEAMYRRAVEVLERTLGRDHRDIAKPLVGLACALSTAGRYLEAEPLFREAIALGDKIFGHFHPDVGQRLLNLSRLLRETGRNDEAHSVAIDALDVLSRTIGNGHPLVGQAHSEVAAVLMVMGQNAEALQEAEAALAIAAKVLPKGHPSLRQPAQTCVRVLYSLGRREEAHRLEAEYSLSSSDLGAGDG